MGGVRILMWASEAMPLGAAAGKPGADQMAMEEPAMAAGKIAMASAAKATHILV